jgi:general secretion pathway protein D
MHARTKEAGLVGLVCCVTICLASSSSASANPRSAPNAAESATELPAKTEFNQCKPLRAGKRIVKLNLKPDSEISDLIAWISSITCKGILIAGTPIQGKKVTILSPQPITPEEAFSLFLGALDAVGLTIEPMGNFLRVIESSRARFSPMPFYRESER